MKQEDKLNYYLMLGKDLEMEDLRDFTEYDYYFLYQNKHYQGLSLTLLTSLYQVVSKNRTLNEITTDLYYTDVTITARGDYWGIYKSNKVRVTREQDMRVNGIEYFIDFTKYLVTSYIEQGYNEHEATQMNNSRSSMKMIENISKYMGYILDDLSYLRGGYNYTHKFPYDPEPFNKVYEHALSIVESYDKNKQLKSKGYISIWRGYLSSYKGTYIKTLEYSRKLKQSKYTEFEQQLVGTNYGNKPEIGVLYGYTYLK